MAFFAELKRRRVGKVAIAYGAIAWAATEASSVVLPALHVPEWVLTAIESRGSPACARPSPRSYRTYPSAPMQTITTIAYAMRNLTCAAGGA